VEGLLDITAKQDQKIPLEGTEELYENYLTRRFKGSRCAGKRGGEKRSNNLWNTHGGHKARAKEDQ